MKLIVTSTAFEHGGYMPDKYTGYGANISPPLALSGLAPEAKSIAVIMVDLDVPFVREYPHWLIWNLPPTAGIPEGIPKGARLPGLSGARQGLAYGRHEYKGPRPPKFMRGRHRYVFTAYALDTVLSIDGDSKKNDLISAMRGHVLQSASIIGLYKNP